MHASKWRLRRPGSLFGIALLLAVHTSEGAAQRCADILQPTMIRSTLDYQRSLAIEELVTETNYSATKASVTAGALVLAPAFLGDFDFGFDFFRSRREDRRSEHRLNETEQRHQSFLIQFLPAELAAAYVGCIRAQAFSGLQMFLESVPRSNMANIVVRYAVLTPSVHSVRVAYTVEPAGVSCHTLPRKLNNPGEQGFLCTRAKDTEVRIVANTDGSTAGVFWLASPAEPPPPTAAPPLTWRSITELQAAGTLETAGVSAGDLFDTGHRLQAIVCRATESQVPNNVVIGTTYLGRQCIFGWGAGERELPGEALIDDGWFTWVALTAGVPDSNTAYLGHVTGPGGVITQLQACRVYYNGGWRVGGGYDNICHISFAGTAPHLAPPTWPVYYLARLRARPGTQYGSLSASLTAP